MTTATYSADRKPEPQVDNERVLGLYGVILGSIATFMVSVFWAMGAVLKATGNGGIIVQLDLQGIWNTLFWAFPFVALGAIVLSVAAFALGRAKEAAGIALLPAVGVVLYYFALVQLR